MAFYSGWNLDKIRQSGRDMSETTMLNGRIPENSTPSFTPINPTAPAVQFISPLKTLHDTDVYDVVECPEEQYESSDAIPKKRVRAQNKGRAVSIDPLWEYVDEGDLAGQNNGNDFETKFPKRRKATSAKRANSMKAAANTISQFFSADDSQATGPDNNQQPDSQSTPSPEAGNKKGKRTVSVKSKSSKPKMGPFKVPTITKPVIAREKQKEDVEEPVQAKPSSYIGHVTTQETVKLAKTTLDRLSAFRYVPPSTTQQTDQTSTNMQHHAPSPNTPPESRHADQDHGFLNKEDYFMLLDHGLEEETPSEGYGDHFPPNERDATNSPAQHCSYPDNNAFFADATWNAQMSSHSQHTGQFEAELHSSIAAVSNEHDDSSESGPNHDEGPTRTNHSDQLMLMDWKEFVSNPLPGGGATHSNPPHSSTQYEPNSSEAMALLNALDTTMATDQTRETTSELYFNDATLPRVCSTPLHNPDATAMVLDVNHTQPTAHQQETTSSQQLPVLHCAQNHHRSDPSKDVQLERSDADDIEMVVGDRSEGYEPDDFDEGLDDSDLMELVSQPVVPATQSIVSSEPPASGDDANMRQQLSQAIEIESSSGNSITNPGNGEENRAISPLSSSIHIISAENDDEFPFDEDLEKEMMNLAVTGMVTAERFELPANLQYSAGSTSGEVYDKNLQSSPPKTKHTARSLDLQTDQNSARLSPAAVPGPPLEEEEDWSFIWSNDRASAEEHTVAPVASRQTTPPEEASSKDVADVSQLTPHTTSTSRPATIRQASTSQLTTATINAILDDRHEYEPLKPFARPDFPIRIRDRSPVVGLSPHSFLRVCFRVAELLKEGARCHSLKEDAVIELFARVTCSTREPGTTRQYFTFADLWHDRPPFPCGILENYKASDLLNHESKVFIGVGEPKMARCFGRLKRDSRSPTGWLLEIMSIRTTDWEEIKWTKRIVSAGFVKSETKGLSKL